uniref:E3 ubiquitin-protein ligase MARCHF5 n=1 Tax=Amphilophus citrinellus TaxID=61819 RepID=A0A3Q0RLJ1_AMPCI
LPLWIVLVISKNISVLLHCWVCFATERDDPRAQWLSPCRCRGSTKWVHLSCLQYWLDTRLRMSQRQPIRCQLCEATYAVIFPRMGLLVDFLRVVDRTLTAMGPYGTLGLLVGSVYWSALTYGAVTVVQVMGRTKGLLLMRRASPLLLLSGLPSIPVLLVLGKTVRWNDYIMKLWRKHWYEPQLPPGTRTHLQGFNSLVQPQFLTSRNLCGALMFPSIAVLTGRLLFPSLTSHLQRALLGGGAYVLLKGVLKVYFKQQLFIMHAGRRILNYCDVKRKQPLEAGESEGAVD